MNNDGTCVVLPKRLTSPNFTRKSICMEYRVTGLGVYSPLAKGPHPYKQLKAGRRYNKIKTK